MRQPARSCARREASARSSPSAARRSGRGRIAFGFSYQFFSYDALDGVRLAAIPAVFTHDNSQAGGGRADVVATTNTVEATVNRFTAALTYGVSDRLDLSLAIPVVATRLSMLSNATIHRIGTGESAVHYFRDPTPSADTGRRNSFSPRDRRPASAISWSRVKGTMMREGSRALAAGLDVRMPTGDEQNLLGSGALGIRPFAAFSS